jgi:hypothetical protein
MVEDIIVKCGRKRVSTMMIVISVLSILLFTFLPSCPLPHTCQLCLPELALRKIALSLKSVFPSFAPTSLSVNVKRRMERTEGEW